MPPTPGRRIGRLAAVGGFLLLIAFPVIAIIEGEGLLLLLPVGLLPLLVWLAWLWFGQIRYLEVSPGKLKIVYRLRRRVVSLDRVAGCERIDKPSASFLYGPVFSLRALKEELAKELGPLEVIATGMADFLLIRFRGNRPSLLVGVSDPEGLERALQEAAET